MISRGGGEGGGGGIEASSSSRRKVVLAHELIDCGSQALSIDIMMHLEVAPH